MRACLLTAFKGQGMVVAAPLAGKPYTAALRVGINGWPPRDALFRPFQIYIIKKYRKIIALELRRVTS